MSVNCGPWNVVDGREPEKEVRQLRRRFGKVSERYFRSIKRRKTMVLLRRLMVFPIAGFVISIGLFALSPFSPAETLRHLASFPNCDAARAMGLAPALRGEPGYWSSHDADGDGIACELWPPVVRR